MDMPQDSAILLSVINMKLRDFYENLDNMCDDLEWSKAEITKKLETIGYVYNESRNQFI